jgi:hypothetical protein
MIATPWFVVTVTSSGYAPLRGSTLRIQTTLTSSLNWVTGIAFVGCLAVAERGAVFRRAVNVYWQGRRRVVAEAPMTSERRGLTLDAPRLCLRADLNRG